MSGYDGRGGKFDLIVVRGADMAFTVTATDSNAAAIDLSSATIAGELYDADGAVVDTMTDVVSGAGSNIITLSFTDAETALLTSASYPWTLWVTRGGDKRPWLAGRARVVDSSNGVNATDGDAITLTVDSDVNVSVSVLAVGGVGGSGDMAAATYDPATIEEQLVGLTASQTLTNKVLNSFTNDIEADAIHVQVRNDSGSTLTAGTPVYVTGYNVGQDLVTVGPADASTTATMPCIGLVETSISNNTNGSVLVVGRLRSLNTSGFSVGDRLYVSETAGTLTATRPIDAAQVQSVGQVIRSNASTGVIDIELSKTFKTGLAAALLTDGTTSAMRTTLGLGTIATQAASSVSITGGSVTGITDITVADGGTGASTAQAAIANLRVTPATVTGTTDTLAAGDDGTVILYTAAGAVTVTLANIATGFEAVLVSLGAAGLSVAAGGMSFANSFTPNLSISQGEALFVKQTAASTWIVLGGTAA